MSVNMVLLVLVAASLGATQAQRCPTDQMCPDDHFCALSTDGDTYGCVRRSDSAECDCRKTHGSDKFCVEDQLHGLNPGCVVDNQCHTGVTGSSCDEKEAGGIKYTCFQADGGASGCVEVPK